jgi:hypothetical protein
MWVALLVAVVVGLLAMLGMVALVEQARLPPIPATLVLRGQGAAVVVGIAGTATRPRTPIGFPAVVAVALDCSGKGRTARLAVVAVLVDRLDKPLQTSTSVGTVGRMVVALAVAATSLPRPKRVAAVVLAQSVFCGATLAAIPVTPQTSNGRPTSGGALPQPY